MKFKLINLIGFLLLLNYQFVASDSNDFLKNFELFQIKKNNQLFTADIEYVSVEEKFVMHIEEKFSYKQNIGELDAQQKSGPDKNVSLSGKIIYNNDISEVYQIDKNQKNCQTLNQNESINSILTNWAPKKIFENTNYEVLGPNVLLTILMEKLEEKNNSIDCGSFNKDIYNCTYFEDEFKLEFHFDKRGDKKTFYPTIIFLYNLEEENPKLIKQFNYFEFKAFNENDLKIGNLPVGYGCERISNPKITYPEVETNFGKKFEMDYEVVFKYLMTEENKPTPSWEPQFLKFVKDQNEKNYLTRIYFNQMYHDDELLDISISYTKRENFNDSIKIIYDLNSHFNYEIMLDSNVCSLYPSKRIHDINYYYVHDLFINHPEFFIFNKNSKYNYIGEYDVHNISCEVFEKKISDFDKKNDAKDDEDEDEENKELVQMIRENKNKVISNYSTVTHYYPKNEEYWGNSEKYKVPIKIEIRLFSNEERLEEIALLTINIANFKSNSQNYEIFDTSNCAQHAYDYNWFLVRFENGPELVQKYSKYETQIKNEFRSLLKISPLRVGEILVDSDENSIYVTAKLLETAKVADYFHSKKNLTITNSTLEEFADTQEICARRCFSFENCAAYSYCSALDCKLFIEENFDSQFDPNNNKDYDWSKIETNYDEQCTYHRRSVKFDKINHLSNMEFLKNLDSRIMNEEQSNKPTLLVKDDDDDKPEVFRSTDLKINVQPGSHTKAISDDERNNVKYNDLFDITSSKLAFNLKKVKGENDEYKERLVALSPGLSLWECQMICVNDYKCKSMSYCSDTNECILTTLSNLKDIYSSVEENNKCVTSVVKFVAMFHKHSKKAIVKNAKKIIQSNSIIKLSENDCASKCIQMNNCGSFDYCEGKEDEGKEKKIACYLHDKDPSKDKTDDKKPEWISETHCEHYTYKHTSKFIEKSAVRLKLKDEDLNIENGSLSLDHCASACIESEKCNTFDFCIDKSIDKHLKSTSCRMSSEIFSKDIVEEKKFDCSVYSRIDPKIKIKKNQIPYNNPVSAGLTTFLSILFLLVGSALGAGIAHYVFRYYFISY